MMRLNIALAMSCLILLGTLGVAESAEIQTLFNRYCVECHGSDTTEADIRFDNIGKLELDGRLVLLSAAQEQLYFGLMPPKDAKQPTEAERTKLADWLSSELRAHNANTLEDKLRKPEYGNYVDHDKLFSGKYKDVPGYTPDRRWLISEYIFEAKMNKLVGHSPSRDIDGKRHQVIGDNNRKIINLTNPFLLPENIGVRYYDTTVLEGGHLQTMMANAQQLSALMLKRAKIKGYLPAIESIMSAEWAHETILANRERYLNASIEQLLPELFKEKNESLMPVFVVTEFVPAQPEFDSKGRRLKTDFDSAAPRGEDLDAIWAGIRKHSTDEGEALVLACERDWFNIGINERKIVMRVSFMRNYINELRKRSPQGGPSKPPAPPAEPELGIIHTAVLKHRQAGDRYNHIIAKCMDEWRESFKQERLKAGGPSDQAMQTLIDQLFAMIIERAPTPEEQAEYLKLTKSYFDTLADADAIARVIEAILLRTDFVYRQELGQGEADEHGRKQLSPRDASYALAYALTDSSPDKELVAAASSGRLNTREDYRREVERMLKNRSQYYIIQESLDTVSDSFTNMPIREIRFFREFFGYPRMLSIFKDTKRFGTEYLHSANRLVSEADMLVEHILEADQNVFARLLTTEDFYVFHSGDNAKMAAAAEQLRKMYDYFKDKDWRNFDVEKLKEHSPFLKEVPIRGVNVDALSREEVHAKFALQQFKSSLTSYSMRLDKGQTAATPYPVFPSHDATEARTRGGKQMSNVGVTRFFNIDLESWSYPTTQPAKIEHRKGMLTHPAWLTALAGNTETDPVRRGKWIQEKLLAGTVPDVPITVDAAIPEDHHKTLRQRLDKKTQVEYCWKCHVRMNPLGTPFEMYDDFGRYRTEESLEHPDNLVKKIPDKGAPHEDLRDIFKTLPVNATGRLAGSGDPALDGDVRDAIDLIERLAKSTRVRQSIIRYAFRYFVGRNELLSDSKTLIDADQAYVQSGGSFNAVIVSLLTSDSFIYRKSLED